MSKYTSQKGLLCDTPHYTSGWQSFPWRVCTLTRAFLTECGKIEALRFGHSSPPFMTGLSGSVTVIKRRKLSVANTEQNHPQPEDEQKKKLKTDAWTSLF